MTTDTLQKHRNGDDTTMQCVRCVRSEVLS